ncbi:hypothetical protein WH52_07305 [Tenacibaculum holothuriorum]|uniref:Outer membrane protein beta-barrel domain-containing protein n=1 Tax=Tenacibaculum holothuriorum TaxID=1635173 RepID=A0A1Y2PDH9_9FLAO|nr:CsgG/HfaB family protein [Tenacibaculum holothuriorum]OSY88546.1 hypothetical protein WH52_07305 [Tenacibaculum holothuriorum]
MKKQWIGAICIFSTYLFTSCGAYFNQPLDTTRARIGENTSVISNVLKYPPKKKTVVGVYKFRDQSGQYKPVETGSTFSTAVTQGGTSILLKSLEESGWFVPIERENIGNLLNERQIIRNTRQEHSKDNRPVKLPPLLFAGVIIEGGVVSYDSNIITGGSGLRYFGAGASNQYRQDRITVYLRAVSTTTGRILKSVYTSKTILSQGITANLYRFVSVRRLLEVETGVTKNEPAQLAVKEAIDKAVELLIVEGIVDGIWKPDGGPEVVNLIKESYNKEKEQATSTKLFNREMKIRRGRNAMSAMAGASKIVGDYSNSAYAFGFDLKFRYLFKKDPHFGFGGSIGRFELENTGIFKQAYLTSAVNFEYNILPYDRLTPYAYVGVGTVLTKNLSDNFFKFQYGGGLEYLLTDRWGILLNAEHQLLGSDQLDQVTRGNKNDQIWHFRLGLNFYF